MDGTCTRRRFLGGLALAAAAGPLAACSGAGSQASSARPRGRVPEPEAALVARWGSDPWTRGSYSYLPVGTRPAERLRLAAPVAERVFLAGEATSRDYSGTAPGAFLTGERAAAQAADAGRAGERVLVIGSGMAGIGAARRLRELGREVTVIEARDAIGGRTRTSEALGAPVDLGAAWFEGVDGNPLVPIARAAGVRLRPSRDVYSVHFTDGRLMTPDQLDASEELGARLVGAALEDASADESIGAALARVVRRERLTPQQRRIVAFTANVEIEQDYCAPIELMSPLNLEEGEDMGGGDFMPATGYGSVVASAAKGLDIRLREPVRVIEWGPGGVVVLTDAGRHTADRVVVTVPLGVLKAGVIEFRPALPAATARAIARLGMGNDLKAILRFRTAFWDPALYAFYWVPPDGQGFTEWYSLLPIVGAPILVGFACADDATRLQRLPDRAVLGEAMGVLRRLYG